MSQAVDNLLKGCGEYIREQAYPARQICCGNNVNKEKQFCPSCKAKAQGMIEILEEQESKIHKQLENLNDSIYNANSESEHEWCGGKLAILEDELEEIQADLNKLKEILK